jgi:hypothetical protein
VTERSGQEGGGTLAADPPRDGEQSSEPDGLAAGQGERARRRAERVRLRAARAAEEATGERTVVARARVSREWIGRVADWLVLVGAVVLFGSLFLTWSHQVSPALRTLYGSSPILRNLPRDPTAWQVYAIADVLLAVLAVALVIVAAAAGRAARAVAAGAVGIALVFVLHATTTPPTNGVVIANPAFNPASYYPNHATAGIGITIALVGLIVALVGLLVSLVAD